MCVRNASAADFCFAYIVAQFVGNVNCFCVNRRTEKNFCWICRNSHVFSKYSSKQTFSDWISCAAPFPT